MSARAAALVALAAALCATPAVRAQEAPAVPPPPVVVTARPGQGVTFTLAQPAFSLNLSTRLQTRFTANLPPSGEQTTEVAIRTLRLLVSGHAFSPDLRYYVQLAFGAPDYDPASASPVFDAWIGYTGLRDAQVRVGQFFVPFDRARTIREATLQFTDRSLTVGELNLDRDVGVELSSKDLFGLGGRLQYALGVFSGEGRNRVGANAGFLYVARLQVNPTGAFDDFVEGDIEHHARPQVSFAVAGAYNQSTLRARSTTGGNYTLNGFDYLHAAADLHVKWAGVSLLAEGLWRHATEDQHASLDAMRRPVTEWSRSAYGYLVQLGVMVGPHAEVVGRWGQLGAATGTDPALVTQVAQQGNELAAGLNWYFAGHPYKLQADWQALFGDAFGQARHTVRLQLQLTL